jgi:plastocyanin
MKTRTVVGAAALLAGMSVIVLAPHAGAGGFCAGYEGETLTDVSALGASGEANVVKMKDNCFDATVMRVSRGATVTWRNTDPEAHAVGGAAGSFGDMHAEVAPGRSVAYRFEEEGVFPYVCILHPGMAGAVVVGDGMGSGVGTVAAEVAPPAPRSDTERSAAGNSSSGLALVAGTLVLLVAAGVARVLLASRVRTPVASERT